MGNDSINLDLFVIQLLTTVTQIIDKKKKTLLKSAFKEISGIKGIERTTTLRPYSFSPLFFSLSKAIEVL